MSLPEGFRAARLCLPGVLVVGGPPYQAGSNGADAAIDTILRGLRRRRADRRFPLMVVVDDATSRPATLNNFLWVTFTRSNPAADVHGIESLHRAKTLGLSRPAGDRRALKPHHAPPLVEDPAVTRRVDALAAAGGPLAGII